METPGETLGISIHSAHSMDLLSRGIEHGSVDTARTAVHAVHKDFTYSHVENMMFPLEFELSSVSVLSDIISDVLPFPSAILVAVCLFVSGPHKRK